MLGDLSTLSDLVQDSIVSQEEESLTLCQETTMMISIINPLIYLHLVILELLENLSPTSTMSFLYQIWDNSLRNHLFNLKDTL